MPRGQVVGKAVSWPEIFLFPWLIRQGFNLLTVDSSSRRAGFPNHGTVDLGARSFHVMCTVLCIADGYQCLWLQPVRCQLQPFSPGVTTKISPDISKCPWGQICPSREPLAWEKQEFRQNSVFTSCLSCSLGPHFPFLPLQVLCRFPLSGQQQDPGSKPPGGSSPPEGIMSPLSLTLNITSDVSHRGLSGCRGY